MDLWCCESSDLEIVADDGQDEDNVLRKECLNASVDKNLLESPKVLERLMSIEGHHLPPCPSKVYSNVQTKVQIHMRKILANWMLEVSEELECNNCVFPLAMNYVDRFLAIMTVNKEQLQLLGSVCLLVASKLRQSRPIHPETLVFYSDYSFTLSDITTWEMLLLTKLKWDVSAIVATDILDHLLARLELSASQCQVNDDNHDVNNQANLNAICETKSLEATLRRDAANFVSLFTTEASFSAINPSLVATACLAAALHGLSHAGKPDLLRLISGLSHITGISDETLFTYATRGIHISQGKLDQHRFG
ncbi:G1/S-specific cyclin-D3 [Halotydeus destructor]|nr:G1/S-specific cyclin-D3 [Halotydeus destructor]